MPKWAKYKKQYRKEWETDPELKVWIGPAQDEGKARCKFCNTEIRAHLKDLRDHAATKKHTARCLAPSVKTFTVSAAKVHDPPSSQKRRELRIATYVACHTSINAVDELSDILQDETGAFQMHRTKCTAVIRSMLAPHFRAELREDVGDSPYSLYLDETTDITVNKLLCICIKYPSTTHDKFVSTYLGLVELMSGDASSVATAVMGFLDECGLSIAALVGIATDGASVMVGKHHSVYTLLRERQPTLKLIRCVCHSLDIVAHKAMARLPSHVEYLIRETYNWFAHSSKRQSDYRAVYETINGGEAPLKLLSPSGTRWLATADCVDRIVSQENELGLHFAMAASAEHCYAARVLGEMYRDKSNSLYLHFLRPVLAEIKAVNKSFQLETGDSVAVFRDLSRLYQSTMRRVIKPSVFRTHSQKQLRELDLASSALYLSPSDADLGTIFGQKMEECSLPPDTKSAVQARCVEFLKELLVQYQMRLPESLELLAQLELICPPAVLSRTTTIHDLPKDFFQGSRDTLEIQLRNVACAGFPADLPIDKFWLEVANFRDAGGNACFQELASGAVKMLTLPISNATVERAFSQVSLLKNDLRNRMGLPLLSSLMDVRAGLARNGLTSATFRPPQSLIEKFNSTIY